MPEVIRSGMVRHLQGVAIWLEGGPGTGYENHVVLVAHGNDASALRAALLPAQARDLAGKLVEAAAKIEAIDA